MPLWYVALIARSIAIVSSDRKVRVLVRIGRVNPSHICSCFFRNPGRGASNGLPQVLLSQLFLFAGMLLSAATLGDCNLVNVADPILVRPDNVTTTALGMLSYMDPDTNRCYFWSIDDLVVDGSTMVKDENSNSITSIDTSTIWTGSDQLTWYMQEVLGEDWNVSHGACVASFVLSVILFLYGISYFCSTQVKACRFFTGCLAGICLSICQGLGMMFVHTSQWCSDEGCSIGRSTYFSIGAAVSFLFAGICFWNMDSWPGQSVSDDIDESRGWETSKKKRSDSFGNKKSKRKTRSFSGDAWVIEAEKSSAEISNEDVEDVNNYDVYDETQAPSSHYSNTQRSEDPQSPKALARNARTRRTRNNQMF